MSVTAQAAVRELMQRFDALTLSTPTGGTTTTLIDASLNQYFPNDLVSSPGFFPFVYGSPDVVAGNVGATRRARSWTASTSTLTFGYAWPTAVTAAGTYEVLTHQLPRARFMQAVNEGVNKLGLMWYRDVIDESLTTLANTWAYTIPASLNLIKDTIRVYMQIAPDLSTFPFARAEDMGLGWEVREQISSIGTRVLTLQFNRLQPIGRTIRLTGQGFYSAFTADSDILATAGPWEGAALTWVYQYAEHLVNGWLAEKVPAGETEKYRVKALTILMEERQIVQDLIRSHAGGRILVPGTDGSYGGPGDSWRWLGAYTSEAFS